MGKRLEQLLHHIRYMVGNKHMKRFSTSLVIREMHIKTTVRYHLTAVRMVIIKETKDDKC